MHTPLQAFRELPFSGFSPYEPVERLPKGAYLGQTVKTSSPENMTFRVMRAHGKIGDNERTPKLVSKTTWYASANTLVENGRYIPKNTKQFQIEIRSADFGDDEPVDLKAIPDDYFTGSKASIIDGNNVSGVTFYITSNTRIKGTSEHWITIDHPLPGELDDPLFYMHNEFASQTVGGPTGHRRINGVALTVIPEGYYFLGLVRGIVPLQMDSSPESGTAASQSNRAVSESNGSETNRIKIAETGDRIIGHILNPSENIEPNAWYLIDLNVE